MAEYALSISKSLEADGFLPSQGWQTRPSVAISEKGKIYRTEISRAIKSAIYQVDGNIIKDGQKCDKLLVAVWDSHGINNGTAVFIELKGKDVSHAIDQLESTIKNRLFTPYPKPDDKVRARIVTSGCGPKSSSRAKLEEARIRFKRQYNIELRVLKNNQTDQPINP